MKSFLTIPNVILAGTISASAGLRGQGTQGIDPMWSHTLAQPAL